MVATTREEKKRLTRKAIVEAAIRLFEQKGYEKTSIEELAREAGVGKGTIYTYFQTKAEIFYAFCEEQLAFVYKELAEKTDPDAPLIDQVMAIFMGDFVHLTENKEFGRFFMQHVLFPGEKDKNGITEIDNKWLDLLFTVYTKAQERGELRQDIDLLYISGHFYALYVLVVHAWYTGRIATKEVAPSMRQLFVQALEGLSSQPVYNHSRIGELHGQS